MSSRYTIIGTLASGGMGTVFLARMTGSAGFSRLVAIKRLHAELAAEREFIAMLVDEARLASQVRHVNVIDTLDLVASDGAFSVVLEYVEGPSLSGLIRAQLRRGGPIPQDIAIAIAQGLLRGLDAAHEARGSEGQPLGIVHRDVSPQNVLVGIDGIPRIIDFGIAKAMGRVASTRPGEVRGKFAYMAPEQLLERPATRQVDVYAAGVCLWEMVTGERLFKFEDQRAVASAVMRGEIKAPSAVNPAIPAELDAIILRATARETSDRYLTAREFLDDLASFKRASDDEVGAWVKDLAADFIAKRSAMLAGIGTDKSRSVEDLMAELQQSATPADGIPIARDSNALMGQKVTLAMRPSSPGGEPVHDPTMPAQEAPSMPSAPGFTSASMSLPAGLPSQQGPKPWLYAIPFASFAVVVLVGALFINIKRPPVPATPPPSAVTLSPVPLPVPAVVAPPPPTVEQTPSADPPPSARPAPTATVPPKKPGKKPGQKRNDPGDMP